MSFHSNIILFEVAKRAQECKARIGALEGKSTLRRPRALWQAAQYGQRGYRRQRDLQRLMGGIMEVPPPGKALAWLTAREARMDEARRDGGADWNLHMHIMLMIALKAEKQLCQQVALTAPQLNDP